jgi:hypothetical protein
MNTKTPVSTCITDFPTAYADIVTPGLLELICLYVAHNLG